MELQLRIKTLLNDIKKFKMSEIPKSLPRRRLSRRESLYTIDLQKNASAIHLVRIINGVLLKDLTLINVRGHS